MTVSGILLFLGSYILLNKNILNALDRLKPNKALKIYENFYKDRKDLYKEFKGDKKGYIYMIVNKLNGKCYVGSSRSIKTRLYNYFNLALAAAQKGRPISSAILKYGLVNFAFIVLEEVDLNVHNLEERETFWIQLIKPEYNAVKEAARNISIPHMDDTKLKISMSRSSGSVYIYDEFKTLLVIVPSLRSLAVLLGSPSISISLKRAMESESLFRSSWYISDHLFNENDKPLINVTSDEYINLIEKMNSQKHIRKAIFVFKDGEFLQKYDGILAAEKALNISHDVIKSNIEKNTTYNGYLFSYHRVN
jgi:group I intron endonuclease